MVYHTEQLAIVYKLIQDININPLTNIHLMLLILE